MSVAAARVLPDGADLPRRDRPPGTAANLARRTHAPRLVLVYESGTIGAKPEMLPLSIGDGILAETADAVVPLVEIFNLWLQPGRIDVGFLGAAQIDRFANINTTSSGLLPRAPGATSRGGRSARDRRLLPPDRDRHAPQPGEVRREARLRHLGRARVGAREPRAPGPARRRAEHRHHRPRHPRARSRRRRSSSSPIYTRRVARDRDPGGDLLGATRVPGARDHRRRRARRSWPRSGRSSETRPGGAREPAGRGERGLADLGRVERRAGFRAVAAAGAGGDPGVRCGAAGVELE